MKYNFCTLFDVGYLDKGIALYRSLERNMKDFTLYVYAFDKRAYDILNDLNYDKMVVLFIDDIETDRMRQVRSERSRAEYCWTCTPIIIENAIETYQLDNCTYVDADTYFYADPACLIEEMLQANCDVLITKHGFPNNREGKITEAKSGKYCVQFNTFLNTKEARTVLSWWKEQCLLCCSSTPIDGKFGDQKYLENWVEEFPKVYESTHFGAGVASWNIVRFCLEEKMNENILIRDRESKLLMPLIFYHFHGLKVLSDNRIDINVFRNLGHIDAKLVEMVYSSYFDEIRRVRKLLREQYRIEFGDSQKRTTKKKQSNEKEPRTLEEYIYMIFRVIKARFYRKKDIYYLD